jgi:hypothetical protein
LKAVITFNQFKVPTTELLKVKDKIKKNKLILSR